MALTDGAAGHVGQDSQGGGVAGVLLTLLGLQSSSGHGVQGEQESRGLWGGERECGMRAKVYRTVSPHPTLLQFRVVPLLLSCSSISIAPATRLLCSSMS